MKKTVSIHSLDELDTFAKNFVKTIKIGDIILLSGPLGAGKTAFVKSMARHLGVLTPITSPTYVYIHTYTIDKNNKKSALLAHIDLYRVENEQVFHSIGIMDYLGNPHVINIIEWGDAFSQFFPYISAKIEFTQSTPSHRTLIIHTSNQ